MVNLRIVRHPTAPVYLMGAEKVVRPEWERGGAGKFRLGICVERGDGNLVLGSFEDGAARGQENAVVVGAGSELHFRRPSAGVRLEYHGQRMQEPGGAGNRVVR